MTTPSTLSAADNPPYRESLNPHARAHGQPPQSSHRQVVASAMPQPAIALTAAYANSHHLTIVA
uniref:Uncharacterized protein n=1 Tax=Romanomermis culicivorax TaxID=13658 RepID=A0A915K078_ROMCU